MYKTALKKIAIVVFLVTMNVVMFNIPVTSAFYNDTESSVENIFQASTLDVNISPENFSDTILPGKATTTTIALSKTNPANLDFKYFVNSTTTDSNTSACDYITISASSSSQYYTNMPLKDFFSAPSISTGLDLWDFTFTVTDGAHTGTCYFKIIYTAWQTDLPDSSGGFSDIAEMTGLITIGQVAPVVPTIPDVVLNEFLPDPEGPDNDPMPNGEWVELYNNTNSPIDLSGYYLTNMDYTHRIDIENCRTNTDGTIISSHGFLVIYAKGNDMCASCNFSLNNNGDTLNLFNPNKIIIDSYLYNTTREGKSFARIPDGTGGWVDPTPTSGEPNMLEEVLIPYLSERSGSSVTAQVAGDEPLIAEIVVEPVPSTEPEPVIIDVPPAVEITPVVDPQPSLEATAGEAEPVVETPPAEVVSE